MSEPVDFLTVPLADGGTWTRLDRLTDGRIMCQLCFGFFHREDLNPVGDGVVEDVCRQCAATDAPESPAIDSGVPEGRPAPFGASGDGSAAGMGHL